MASFDSLFSVKKPVIGMIHLAGEDHYKKVNRALRELQLYQEEGVDGAIVEDYYGDLIDVSETLRQAQLSDLTIPRGVNFLRDPYRAFSLARRFGAKFVQFDSVEISKPSMRKAHKEFRKDFKDIVLLGGIRFKYSPETGRTLKEDIADGIANADAIVTTGSGTGVETPLEKLVEFRRYMPAGSALGVGAGVNIRNAYAQAKASDFAIVGTYLKRDGKTENEVDRIRVRDIVQIFKQVRSEDVENS